VSAWRLRFWGTRGSIPSPGPGTVRYGGNTACTTLEPASPGGGPTLVLDAGTGIRACGAAWEQDGRGGEAEVLLSHVHWDHVQGFPFFAPLHQPGARVRVRGPRPGPGGLAEVLGRLLAPEVFPVHPAARLLLEELGGESFEAAGWTVRPFRLCHPGPTLGYRFRRAGVADLAYVTDNELAGELHGVGPEWRPKLVDFLGGVHTLVHDATNAASQARERRGWGHSSAAESVALAAEAGCRRLLLFHHDPGRDDAGVDRQVQEARALAAEVAPGLTIEAAAEGTSLPLAQEE
jgi:phosphoribosyl 1,2-cyclic phosphodiesterase